MSWLLDARHSLRQLLRAPGFTLPVLLVLGLGIGANTAIFSVVRGVLLSPLPYPEPDRLAMLWSRNLPQGHDRFGVSSQDFSDWAAAARRFQHLAAYQVRSGSLTGGGEPRRVRYAVVTRDFPQTIGVTLQGRPFEDPVDAGSCIISHALWRSRFDGAVDTLGRPLVLDGAPCTIIGVLPEGFDFPSNDVEIWLPLDLSRDPSSRGARWLHVIGRLHTDVPVQQAQVEMSGIAAALSVEHPGSNSGWDVLVEPLQTAVVSEIRPILLVVWASLGIVLLLACANLANLLLVRAGARRRELAVRAALGAGRWRIVRQLLTESLMLALAGGLLSLPVAVWGVQIFTDAGAGLIPRAESIRPEAGLLLFTMALSSATGLAFGLIPAWHATRRDLIQRLRVGGITVAGGPQRMRGILVAVETALALVVLVGAGLLLRSFTGLLLTNPGFNPDGLLTMRIEPPLPPPPLDQEEMLPWYLGERARAAAFYRDLIPRLEAVPGVISVSAINRMPITGGSWMSSIEIDGRRSEEPDGAFFTFTRPVLPGYFETMQTRVVQGRSFDWSDDAGSFRVALVNETAARLYWPGESPIGQRIRTPGIPDAGWVTIVGVAADVRLDSLATPARPTTYYPLAQAYEGFAANWGMDLVVRSETMTEGLGASLTRVIRSADADLPVFAVRTMRDVVATSIAGERLVTLLLSMMGGLTLVLAVAGVYSVIAFIVGQQRREMGIRMALGARRWHLYRLTLGHGMPPIAAGLATGLAMAALLTRFLAGLLHGVTPTDTATFIAITALLAAAALAACAIPARRAARIDVLSTLREE